MVIVVGPGAECGAVRPERLGMAIFAAGTEKQGSRVCCRETNPLGERDGWGRVFLIPGRAWNFGPK